MDSFFSLLFSVRFLEFSVEYLISLINSWSLLFLLLFFNLERTFIAIRECNYSLIFSRILSIIGVSCFESWGVTILDIIEKHCNYWEISCTCLEAHSKACVIEGSHQGMHVPMHVCQVACVPGYVPAHGMHVPRCARVGRMCVAHSVHIPGHKCVQGRARPSGHARPYSCMSGHARPSAHIPLCCASQCLLGCMHAPAHARSWTCTCLECSRPGDTCSLVRTSWCLAAHSS